MFHDEAIRLRAHYRSERAAFSSDRGEPEELALNRDISLLTAKIYRDFTNTRARPRDFTLLDQYDFLNVERRMLPVVNLYIVQRCYSERRWSRYTREFFQHSSLRLPRHYTKETPFYF